MSTVVQCDDGSYINAALVYRWSITGDVTAGGESHIIQAHVAGPQRPFLVATRETREAAELALTSIVSMAAKVIPGGSAAYQWTNGPRGDH